MKVTTDDFRNFIEEITAKDFDRSMCCSFVKVDKTCHVAVSGLVIAGIRYATEQEDSKQGIGNALIICSQPHNMTITIYYDSIEMDEVTPDIHEPNEEVWQYSFHKEGVEDDASLIFEFN